MKSYRYWVAVILLGLTFRFSHAINYEYSFPVTDGIEFTHIQSDTSGVLHNINIIKIDYKRKDLEILAATATPTTGRKRTSTMTREYNAIAGVNGGYFSFSPPTPIGLVIHEGKIRGTPVKDKPARCAIGFTPSHRVVIDRVEMIDGKVVGMNTTDWSDVTEALNGGPTLVQHGKLTNLWKEEALGVSFNKTTHPRTAIGVTKDSTVILVVADGRQPKVSIGMPLDELGNLMINLGCTDAMNLDGGGSSTMVLWDTVMNYISDDSDEKNRLPGVERLVADAIVVKKVR
jgi:exopolysaccharide biosynthesis protein